VHQEGLFHVPEVIGVILEFYFVPADENAAVMRIFTFNIFGDEGFPVRSEYMMIDLIGCTQSLRSGGVMRIHIPYQGHAFVQDIQVFPAGIFKGLVVSGQGAAQGDR